MYTVCITFADETKDQYFRSMMDREEYGREMRRWEKQYQVDVTHVDEMKDGDRFIFVVAKERHMAAKKNMETSKSRRRYYTRKQELEAH